MTSTCKSSLETLQSKDHQHISFKSRLQSGLYFTRKQSQCFFSNRTGSLFHPEYGKKLHFRFLLHKSNTFRFSYNASEIWEDLVKLREDKFEEKKLYITISSPDNNI